MNDKFEELFKAMHQFHKLRMGEMMPNVSGADFWAMNNIVNKSEDGKITISELAKKTNVLPSAISRTIRGLEDKGYVERTINKNDRRNTYVEMTDRGIEVIYCVCEIITPLIANVNHQKCQPPNIHAPQQHRTQHFYFICFNATINLILLNNTGILYH